MPEFSQVLVQPPEPPWGRQLLRRDGCSAAGTRRGPGSGTSAFCFLKNLLNSALSRPVTAVQPPVRDREKGNPWAEAATAAHRPRPKGSHQGPLFLLLLFVDALCRRRGGL